MEDSKRAQDAGTGVDIEEQDTAQAAVAPDVEAHPDDQAQTDPEVSDQLEETVGQPDAEETSDARGAQDEGGETVGSPGQQAAEAIREVQFDNLRDTGGSGQARSVEMLYDISLPVSVELGRTSLLVKDVLDLGPGSVVELNKLAGEPVDILVNGKLVARGEVVVVDENFGVRISNVCSPEERVKNLT
jgi:flagellar motor switch protein FliN/FliY